MRLLLLLSYTLFRLAFGLTRYSSLNIANNIVSPDGFPRSAITINGTTPGPPIFANKGDNILVNVRNYLTDPLIRRSTTVHWHGIYQKRRPQDDGPAGVTQCPIGPNDSYVYFVEIGEQAGTFWYHGHLSTQYVDGLRGPLIVYDPKDPHRHLYDIDDESSVITLSDWYQSYSEQLAADWLAGLIPEPVPDSALLNGVGRYRGGPEIPRALITVEKGKRYRFRLINMSAVLPFKFAVEGHYLTVIEADGVNHVPLTVASLSISAGQRYSIVLNANLPVDNYWIAYPSVFLNHVTTPVNLHYNGTEAFAILRYRGAPETEPRSPQHLMLSRSILGPTSLKEYQLRPLASHPPPPPDLRLVLNFTTTSSGDSSTRGLGNKWLVNGITYRSPKFPTLLRILSGARLPNFGPATATYVLPFNRTVEVELVGDAAHPFHLHGHVFSVIQSATGPRNDRNPPIRDTVDTSNDLMRPVTIRFRTDNPGPWLLHCHKDWHLEAGLAIVFIEDARDQRNGHNVIQPSNDWKQLCLKYYQLPHEMQ